MNAMKKSSTNASKGGKKKVGGAAKKAAPAAAAVARKKSAAPTVTGKVRTSEESTGKSSALSQRSQSVSASAKLVTARLKAVNSIPVDMSVDPSSRPLTGLDIESFRARHRLQIPDMTYMLALQSGSQYNKLANSPLPLPYAAEFMIRICDAFPSPPPWINYSMHEAFDQLYGATLSKFEEESPLLVEHARVVLYYRFTALFGRSSFTGYRWIENEGAAKRSLYRVVAKVFERSNPLQTVEEMARLIWRVRGIDFDESFPMPSKDNIYTGPRRGRLPGAAARKAASLQADLRGI